MKHRVLSQKPHWGRERARGARVSLLVGKGPKKPTGVVEGGGGAGGGGGVAGGQGGTVTGLPTLGPIIPRRLPPYIAYSSAGEVWLIEPDGSNAHQIGPPEADSPVWSPDATEIVYRASAPHNDEGITTDEYVMNADGSDPHPVMPSAGAMWADGEFQWSPDGRQLVFTHSEEMGHSVEIANADGTDVHPVPNTVWGGDASFSPDGSYLVFDSINDGSPEPSGPPHLFVIRPDGTDLHEVTSGNGEEEPSWSPDGTRIVYACLFGTNGQPHAICELSGSPLTQRILYSNQDQTFLRPIWNATGTAIVVTIEQPVPAQIALMSPSGGAPVEITDGTASSWFPDW